MILSPTLSRFEILNYACLIENQIPEKDHRPG